LTGAREQARRNLDIRNTTGPGALTVANGILVVDAINGATTTPGAFALANGELRIAGRRLHLRSVPGWS
jgi:Autochaperone Domain Type 1